MSVKYAPLYEPVYGRIYFSGDSGPTLLEYVENVLRDAGFEPAGRWQEFPDCFLTYAREMLEIESRQRFLEWKADVDPLDQIPLDPC